MLSFTPTTANAQSGGGNPNYAQVEQIINDIEDDVTPAQMETIREAQRENFSCLAEGLIDAGFTYLGGGGAGGSITALMSNLATCPL